ASKSERVVCAPLLEIGLTLDRDLSGGRVILRPRDDAFTVNFPLVGDLLGTGHDDLQDRLADLSELVPGFPIARDEFRDFWNGFRMVAAGLPLAGDLPERSGRGRSRKPNRAGGRRIASDPDAPLKMVDFYRPRIARDEKFRLLPATMVMLDRRGGHMFSVLRELEEASEAPLDQTAFAAVYGSPSRSTGSARRRRPATESPPSSLEPSSQSPLEPPSPNRSREIFPLPLTSAQEEIVRCARSAPLTVVTGPPGCGKSYTITALALDAVLRGESVLIASQMDKAVEVVADHLERVAGEHAVARSGGRAAQRLLADKLSRMTGPKSPFKKRRRKREASVQAVEERHAELTRRLLSLEDRFHRAVEAETEWSRADDDVKRLAPICPLPLHDVSSEDVLRAKAAARRARAASDSSRRFTLIQDASLITFLRVKKELQGLRKAMESPRGWAGNLGLWWRRGRATRWFQPRPSRDVPLEDLEDALRRWWGDWNKRRALEALAAAECESCSLDELEEAVYVQGRRDVIRRTERELRSPFPADLLWEEIQQIDAERNREALRLLRLRREEVLRALVGNQAKREHLRLFRTLLRRRNHKL
ncbi:MAG: PhoH family protein, partial [Planctomycetales bacterium]